MYDTHTQSGQQKVDPLVVLVELEMEFDKNNLLRCAMSARQ